MSKIKLSQYTTKRKVRKIVNDKEQIVSEQINIHYNAATPSKHRMLR